VAFFGCFTSVPFCGSSIFGGRLTLPRGLVPQLGERSNSPSASIQRSISKQNIFSVKELVLRQLVFWSGITECTSQWVKNILPFKTRPFPTRSTTNVLLFSHLGHVGKCVLRELAGCPPGEGARLDECYGQGPGLFLFAGLWIAAKSPSRAHGHHRSVEPKPGQLAAYTQGNSSLHAECCVDLMTVTVCFVCIISLKIHATQAGGSHCRRGTAEPRVQSSFLQASWKFRGRTGFEPSLNVIISKHLYTLN
jgi:hypothetical protein